ncbi:hypothetical protein OKW41_009171 [Paraburkholderia sp. UCT70]
MKAGEYASSTLTCICILGGAWNGLGIHGFEGVYDDYGGLRAFDDFVDVRIPRQTEHQFHGEPSTDSTASRASIPRQIEQGFRDCPSAISTRNRAVSWRDGNAG